MHDLTEDKISTAAKFVCLHKAPVSQAITLNIKMGILLET